MTNLEAIEHDIEMCHTLIKESTELEKALNSKAGKLILKSLHEGKDSAAKLMTNANADLQKQGILGVQAVVWAEQHFDYSKQIAKQAEGQLVHLEEEKTELLSDVE